MNKFLMAFAAILISATTMAQCGKHCPRQAGCMGATAAVNTDVPTADAAVATAALADVPTATTVTEPAGVICPSRPGCICPNGTAAAQNAPVADVKAEGVAPCPNRPGCICH